MPNRNLAAKNERARRQAREAAHMEYSKSGYATARPFIADNATVKCSLAPKPARDTYRPRVAYNGVTRDGIVAMLAAETFKPEQRLIRR
jgi:hypothetical protein